MSKLEHETTTTRTGRHGRMDGTAVVVASIAVSDRAQHIRTCNARTCVRKAALGFAASEALRADNMHALSDVVFACA